MLNEEERILLGEGALEEDGGLDLETSSGVNADLAKRAGLHISVNLGSHGHPPSTPCPKHSSADQSTLGSHPGVGGAPGAAPASKDRWRIPASPCCCYVRSPRKVGRFCLTSFWKERMGHLPAGMRKRRGGAVVSSAGLS